MLPNPSRCVDREVLSRGALGLRPEHVHHEEPTVRLRAGDPAPDFRLLNQDGEEVSLADFVGRRVALFFYPKALTPG